MQVQQKFNETLLAKEFLACLANSRFYMRSIMVAVPMPPPVHIVISAVCLS